jgi:hypothetical protein
LNINKSLIVGSSAAMPSSSAAAAAAAAAAAYDDGWRGGMRNPERRLLGVYSILNADYLLYIRKSNLLIFYGRLQQLASANVNLPQQTLTCLSKR